MIDRLCSLLKTSRFSAVRLAGGLALLFCFSTVLLAQNSGKDLRQGFLNPSANARPMMR